MGRNAALFFKKLLFTDLFILHCCKFSSNGHFKSNLKILEILYHKPILSTCYIKISSTFPKPLTVGST